MKKIILTFLLFLSVGTFAKSLSAFIVSGATDGHYASVYIVAGQKGVLNQRGVETYNVKRVFKKIGTFEISNGEVSVPQSEYNNYGFRRPNHILVITHDQRDLALHKYTSNDISIFEDPDYNTPSEMVFPTAENLQYRLRKAVSFNNVNSTGEFIIE